MNSANIALGEPLDNSLKAGRREWLGLAVLALPCLVMVMDFTILNLARVDAADAGGRQRAAVATWLIIAGRPPGTRALVSTLRGLALLPAAAGPVLGTRRRRAGAVGADAAAGGELGVEDVERVGGDLGDVDVVERPQVAGDDPAVLLERVRRPAPLLDRDPLCAEVPERARRADHVTVGELDRPAVALRLPCRERHVRMGLDGVRDGLARKPEKPRSDSEASDQVSCGTPNGIRSRVATLTEQ
jgi:hypothetical protein